MAYEFRKIEKTIGAFIVVAFLLFIGAIIFIAKGQGLIAKKNYYSTICNTAEGLSSSTAIKYKGVEIGKVKKIYLDENNDIIIKFYIYRENASRIKTDSVVKVIAPILGKKSLELSEGATNSELAKNNSILYSTHSEKGRDMLASQESGEIKSAVDAIMQNVELLTAELADPRGSLQTVMKNLKKFTSVFAGLSKDNKDLFTSMIKDLRATTKNFKEMSASMKRNPLFGSWTSDKKKK